MTALNCITTKTKGNCQRLDGINLSPGSWSHPEFCLNSKNQSVESFCCCRCWKVFLSCSLMSNIREQLVSGHITQNQQGLRQRNGKVSNLIFRFFFSFSSSFPPSSSFISALLLFILLRVSALLLLIFLFFFSSFFVSSSHHILSWFSKEINFPFNFSFLLFLRFLRLLSPFSHVALTVSLNPSIYSPPHCFASSSF